ncbi:MAG: GNAT family N-acetyltransferase [Christensenellales bacterium]
MARGRLLLEKRNKINYAARCKRTENAAGNEGSSRTELFGDADCAGSCWFFGARGYEIQNYLSEKTLGDAAAREMEARFGMRYEEALAMAFMEARTLTEPSSPEVEAANEDDLDEIYACMERFLVECNLQDKPNREAMRRNIGGFRVIRADGKIVSMGKAVRDIGESMRITNVYTREAYRGKGYARKVVNTIKNEILTAGKTAALNVDRRNPVTNHSIERWALSRFSHRGISAG